MSAVIIISAAGLVSLFRTTSVSSSFKPYIANLLLANLSLAVFENPLDILLELSCQHWTLSWAICDLYLYCNYVITAWAIHAHLLITVNRLWALVFPYSYRDQHIISTSFLFIGGALVYVHIWSVPGLVLDSVFYRSMNDECEVNNDAQRTWALALQICLFLAPIVFVAGAYMYIIDRQRMRWKTRPGTREAPLSQKPTDGKSSDPPAAQKNTRQQNNQAFLILTLLTCSVVITWTPYQVCQLLQILDMTVADDVIGALDVLWIIQSVLDPVLSTSIVSDVWAAFQQWR
ncbi:probable G-protein coupled receptor No18 [Paramacrobiotus metropolitanus]|uniref:probable G-protein coupled receptor No18 n=1 Tax=Paramacrobiotus metropolitanus TaxID=2943436 RepID=UPI002445F5E7|nr:probable G-protein coupled receptor No18 [Paramacrobiotus metropolitanus]